MRFSQPSGIPIHSSRPAYFLSATLTAFLMAGMAGGNAGAAGPVRLGIGKYQGKTYPIYSETSDQGTEKYLLLDPNRKVDLRTQVQSELDRERAEFGTFTRGLRDKLATAKDEDLIDVRIVFRQDPPVLEKGGPKPDREQGMARRSEAYARGLSRLGTLFGGKAAAAPAFSGDYSVNRSLTRAQIARLKYDPEIRSVLLSHGSLPLAGQSASLGSSVFNGTGGGIDMSPFCGATSPSYCGQGVTVGVVEVHSLPATAVANYFYGSWLSRRPGTPLSGEDPHGAWVAGVLRNSLGNSAASYEYGGSRSLGAMKFSFPLASDAFGYDAYEWVLGQGARITNSSYYYHREVGSLGNQEAMQYETEMDYDMHAATWPYALNIIAAGNSGEATGQNGDFIGCMDGSSRNPEGGWSAEECQRITWWNHNSLIVGAMDNATTRAPYSSWGNGPTGDEGPHIMVRGSYVEMPWMKPYNSPMNGCYEKPPGYETTGQICGTSFSAPAATSLAANLVSKYSGLLGYPEALKAVIMASADPLPSTPRWTTSITTDLASGAGVPNATALNAIAGNPKTGLIFSTSSASGYTSNFFNSGDGSGVEHTYSITVSQSTAQNLQWWVTWMGDPSNHPADQVYAADDVDITVSRPGASAGSALMQPSTEHVSIYKPAGTVTFTVKIKLYSRNSVASSPVFYAIAWRGTGTAP